MFNEVVNAIKGEFTIYGYYKAWKIMTGEPDVKESATPEKLLIDNPSDFQFHAAYLAYSDVYDKTPDAEARRELNRLIDSLHENEIDYPAFYTSLNRYRRAPSHEFSRTMIRTQRKKEWRRSSERQERNKRHRK